MANSARSAARRSGLRSGHSLRALIASGIPPPACGSITITHFHALSGRASAGRQPGIRSRSPFPSAPRCTKTSSPSVLTP